MIIVLIDSDSASVVWHLGAAHLLTKSDLRLMKKEEIFLLLYKWRMHNNLKVWWHAATLFIYFYINRAYIQYFIL